MTTQPPHSLAHAEVNAVLTILADAMYANDRAVMHDAFIEACVNYDVDLEPAVCDCGKPAGWQCVCDAAVDRIHEQVWEGEDG